MSAAVRIALAGGLLVASSAAAQDALTTARELYASAAYEEALTTLARVTPDVKAKAGVEVDRYRALCLIALGKAQDAERAIESIVAADPFFQLASADAAPRVRTAFSTVRRRMLPIVARRMYADAKAAFDRKAYPEAVQLLDKTVRVIDLIDTPNRADLADLRLLASGFLVLSHAAVNPPPQPPLEAEPTRLEVRTVSEPVLPSTDLVVLKQDLPPLPASLAASGKSEYRGIIEVDIDETGRVTGARMVQAVHAFYDPLVIRATRDWRYEAPRVFGKPIPSRKRVAIVLRR
jgi:hypothetical protein